MEITINGTTYENPSIKDGQYTVLQICEQLGYTIPRFCYHDKLSVAGNCRMCLVEMENAPKPIASCAFPQTPKMVIHTNSLITQKAREGVLEFLLLNHPLDCPICDQGGECDLQDQELLFGNDSGRYYDYKRSVSDKNCGPLVKTIMTRCIHCTRCVRFATEVAGIEDLGATGRGNNVEIGTYIEKILESEVSGNVIDLCPVGALTSKPYAFKGRPWELTSSNSIDTTNSMGSHIRLDVRNNRVLRVLPKPSEYINGDWIDDKSRFYYDGFIKQRLSHNKESLLKFTNQLDSLFQQKHYQILFLIGGSTDAHTLFLLKTLASLNNKFCVSDTLKSRTGQLDFDSLYSLEGGIQSLDSSTSLFTLGGDLRITSPLIHSKLISSKKSAYTLGTFTNSTAGSKHVGIAKQNLLSIAQGTHPMCKNMLDNNFQYLATDNLSNIVSGWSLSSILFNLSRTYGNAFKSSPNSSLHTKINYGTLLTTSNDYLINSLNIDPLTQSISNESSYATSSQSGKNVLFQINSDTRKLLSLPFLKKSSIYMGSHLDIGAASSEYAYGTLLPIEKESLFINTEGRHQITSPVVSSPKGINSTNEWEIFYNAAISKDLAINSPWTSILNDISIRNPNKNPQDMHSSNILTKVQSKFSTRSRNSFVRQGFWLTTGSSLVIPSITNFYLSDPTSRASLTMNKCSLSRPSSNYLNY